MSSQDNEIYKLAIPNKGRLKNPTIEILKQAGYQFRVHEKELFCHCINEALSLIFLRTQDIPVLVNAGVIDYGITGSDNIIETGSDLVETILPFDYGKCKICLIMHNLDSKDIKKISTEKRIEWLQTKLSGKKIATSFNVITQSFIKKNKINAQVVKINGSVEAMISLGMADAIVDIVETGDTLKANKLSIIQEIGFYQAQLISRKEIVNSHFSSMLKQKLQGIIYARKYSLIEYNVPAQNLLQAEKITPGYNSPTINKMENKNWYSIRAMVLKSNVLEVMDQLVNINAEAILETPITNCRL